MARVGAELAQRVIATCYFAKSAMYHSWAQPPFPDIMLCGVRISENLEPLKPVRVTLRSSHGLAKIIGPMNNMLGNKRKGN